jgi:hypothetical protein
MACRISELVLQTGEEQWHVLADPEGNEFCLLKTRLDPL